jgi:hypothetical protein
MGSREADKYTDKLSKENFDLKLRIYLIEEHRAKQETENESLRSQVEVLEVEKRELEVQNTELERKVVQSSAEFEDIQDDARHWREEHDDLRDKYEEARKENAMAEKERLQLAADLKKSDHAVDEAVTMINHLEEQVASLQAQLKTALSARSMAKVGLDSGYYSAETDTDGGDCQSVFTPSVSSASRPSTASCQPVQMVPQSPSIRQQESHLITSPTPQPIKTQRLRPRRPSQASIPRTPTSGSEARRDPMSGTLRNMSHLSRDGNALRNLYHHGSAGSPHQRPGSATISLHDINSPIDQARRDITPRSASHHGPHSRSSAESMVDDRSEGRAEITEALTPVESRGSAYNPNTADMAGSEAGDDGTDSNSLCPPGQLNLKNIDKIEWPTSGQSRFGPVRDMFWSRDEVDDFFYPKRKK